MLREGRRDGDSLTGVGRKGKVCVLVQGSDSGESGCTAANDVVGSRGGGGRRDSRDREVLGERGVGSRAGAGS
jgi:hypothetical protein